MNTAKIDLNLVSLRMFLKEDIPQLLQWSLAPDFMFYFGNLVPDTIAKQKEEWVRRLALQQLAFSPRQTLMILDAEQKNIGFITLANIDWRNRHCAFEIYMDEKHRQQGQAIVATTLAFRYVFEQLNLHKIYSYVLQENKSVAEMHKILEQKPEAVFSRHYQLNGKFYDVMLYGYYREDILSEIKKRT
jgi:diamine N-acetyltransferase